VITTRFTELFDIEHPIASAPMALHSGGTLAAAVTAAGGLGLFGGVTRSGPAWIAEQAELVRASSDGPFGIGFITAFIPMMEPLFDAALAARPDVIALSFGDPQPWIDRAHESGTRVLCQVQTPADVGLAVGAGADVLVVQGNDAGGHTGTMDLLPFLRTVRRDHPDAVLLAAGGIGDGRALADALQAGADGAWLGTVLLATPECVEATDEHKRAIVDSDGTDTVFTRAYDIASGLPWPAGIGERMRRDEFTDEWTDRDDELRASGAKPTSEPNRYGPAAAAVTAITPAADVIRRIVDEAERLRNELDAS
jgi:nitronate monooxygenase